LGKLSELVIKHLLLLDVRFVVQSEQSFWREVVIASAALDSSIYES